MILVAVELFFAVIMKVVFYFMKDPFYSFSIEFEHVFHEFGTLRFKKAEIFRIFPYRFPYLLPLLKSYLPIC